MFSASSPLQSREPDQINQLFSVVEISAVKRGSVSVTFQRRNEDSQKLRRLKRYTKIDLMNCVTLGLDTGPQMSVMFGCFYGSLDEFGQDHLFLSQTIPRCCSAFSWLEA